MHATRNRSDFDVVRGELRARPTVNLLDAVGPVFRHRWRWPWRRGMLIIARSSFCVRLGGAFGRPSGFHRRRKLLAALRREIQLFFPLLTSGWFRRLGPLGSLGGRSSGPGGRFSRGFQLLCCVRRL